VPGELIPIGRRPKLVASFAGVGADDRYRAWRSANAELLSGVPEEAFKVEYASAGSARLIRVRVDETALPAGLEGPNEAGAADGLPPTAA
jgi:hypothetical protein